MKKKRNISILCAILLVAVLAAVLLGKKGNVKASVLRDLETEGETSLSQQVTLYEKEMTQKLTVMEQDLDTLEESHALSDEEMADLKKAYGAFSNKVTTLLAEMKEEVNALEQEKLDKVDLEAYQKEMAREIAGMKSNIASVQVSDGKNEEQNSKVTKTLEKMEQDLLEFQTDYESSNSQMEANMKALQKEIGNRKSTIYENYEGGLWEAIAEYENKLQTYGQENSRTRDAIADTQLTLEEMKQASENNMNSVHNSLDSLSSNVDKKLDITAFQTYQEGVNLSISDMLAEIDELKNDLAKEKSDRTVSDAQINARIDALSEEWNSFQVNGTMTLAQIESSLAALQQVIGQEDISGIGDGTVSSAIASLWEQCGDCRIYYDETSGHFYASYMDGDQTVTRQLDYMSE